jgi:hypothetical protein
MRSSTVRWNAFDCRRHAYDSDTARYQVSRDALIVSGVLSWTGELDGLIIPAQPIVNNRPFLSAPISDEQIVRIERKRAGGQVMLDLRLNGIGTVSNSTWVLSSNFAPTVVVPRDKWLEVLVALGAGTRRIVELPPPPEARGPKWDEAARRIEAASWRLSSGDAGAALSESRTAYERTLEALGDELGRPRKEKEALKNFADVVATRIDGSHLDRSDDAYVVLAATVRLAAITFGFASHPVHRGLDTTERINAELALQLISTLYTYFARVTVGGLNLVIKDKSLG